MSKPIKAWVFAVVGDGADIPMLSTFSETEEGAILLIEKQYREPFSVWKRNGYRVRRIEIRVMPARKVKEEK